MAQIELAYGNMDEVIAIYNELAAAFRIEYKQRRAMMEEIEEF